MVALVLLLVLISWMVKPLIVDKVAQLLNRFVVHGQSVSLQDLSIRKFSSPTILEFDQLVVIGKGADSTLTPIIRCKKALLAFQLAPTLKKILVAMDFPSFKFHPQNVDLEIELIQFDQPQMVLEVFDDTIRNHNIFRPDARLFQAKDKRLNQIKINHLVLVNCQFQYQNVYHDHSTGKIISRNYRINFDSADINLLIKRESIDFNVNRLKGTTEYLGFDSIRVLLDTYFEVQGHLTLNKMEREKRATGNVGSSLLIDNIHLTIGEQPFFLDGYYIFENRRNRYHMELSSDIKASLSPLETILKVLPQSNADLVKSFNIQGDMQIKAIMTKEGTIKDDPHIEIKFTSQNASFDPKISLLKNDQRISNLTVRGIYSNGPKNSLETAFLQFDSIQADIGSPLTFQGVVRLDSIYDPQKIYITSFLQIEPTSLPDLLAMLDTVHHYESDGEVGMTLGLEGQLKDLNLANIDKIQYNGKINFHDLNFFGSLKSFPVRLANLNGYLELDNSNIRIYPDKPLTGSINDQEVVVNGTIYNIAQYVVRQKEGLDPVLTVEMDILLHNLSLMELVDSVKSWVEFRNLNLGTPQDSLATKGFAVYYKMDNITQRIDLKMNLRVDTIDFSQFINDSLPTGLIYEKLNAQLILSDSVLEIQNMTLTNSMDSIGLSFKWDGRYSNQARIEANINFHTRDLKHFLEKFHINTSWGKINDTLLTASGNLSLKGKIIKGEENDQLEIELKVEDGNIMALHHQLEIKDFKFHVSLTQDNILHLFHKPILVDSIYLSLEEAPIRGQLMIQDWQSKYFDLMVESGGLPFNTIYKYLYLVSDTSTSLHNTLEQISIPRGQLKFKTHLSGKLDSLHILQSLMYVSQEGFVIFEDFGFDFGFKESDPLIFDDINGGISYDPIGLTIDSIRGNFGKSNFLITGYGQDFLPFLLDGQGLKGDFTISSRELDLTDLAARLTNKTLPNNPSPDTTQSFSKPRIIDRIYLSNFTGLVNLDRMFYQQSDGEIVEFNNVHSMVKVQDHQVHLDTLSFDYYEGSVYGQALVDLTDTSKLSFSSRLKIDSVEIERPLRTWELYKKIPGEIMVKGNLTADIWIEDSLIWDNYWELGNTANVYITNMVLTRGSMDSLAMSNALVWKKLPKSARFGMKNFLSINRQNLHDPSLKFILSPDSLILKDGIIYIDSLEVQSNKGHFLIKGRYDLDGDNTKIKFWVLRARKRERSQYRDFDRLKIKDYSRSDIRPFIKFKPYTKAQKIKIARKRKIPVEEVEEGKNKVYSNWDRTVGALPRRFILMFKKNENREKRGSKAKEL